MAYGTLNADVVQSSVSGVSLGAGNASIMKNRIINGAMVIDQRNAGASVATTTTASYVYTVDRFWYAVSAASKFTVQQNAASVTPPVGFVNYLGCTSTAVTSLAAGDYYAVGQFIEGYNIADLGWGTANAKTVTLSFQVYSSLTGTFGGSLRNGAVTRSYPFTYSIPVANTWTQISITVAGDTSGTWEKTTGQGICVAFGLGIGTTLSGTAGAWAGANYLSATGATSVVGTNGATFYITGVQLEVGSSATGFEYRQYQQELALCQRYCFRPNSNTAYVGGMNNTTSGLISIIFPVTMRSAPTASFSGTFTVDNFLSSGTCTSANTSLNIATVDFGRPYFTIISGYTGAASQVMEIGPASTGIQIYSSEL
jgi:hypothetical protein